MRTAKARLMAAVKPWLRPAAAAVKPWRRPAAAVGTVARRPVVVGLVTALAAAGITVAVNLTSRAPAAPATPAATAATELPQLAFTSTADDPVSGDVWTAHLGGGPAPADLTRRPRLVERSPAYSPDGRRIAYAGEEALPPPQLQRTGIVVAGADGGEPHAITTSIHHIDPDSSWLEVDDHPTWSRDGSLIAFTHLTRGDNAVSAPVTASQIYVVKADGAADDHQHAVVAKVPCGDPCLDSRPAWSPDGTKIAFVRNFRSSVNPETHLFTVDVAQGDGGVSFPNRPRDVSGQATPSSAPPCVECSLFQQEAPDWSPGSDAIVYARGPEDAIRILDPAASSADGGRLVVDGPHTGTLPSGSTPGTGTPLLGFGNPAFTPDGKGIVFDAFDGSDGPAQLHLVPVPAPNAELPPLVTVTPVAQPGGLNTQATFRPQADLVTTLQPDPAAIPLDSTSTLTLTVFNDGTHVAPNAGATITLPAGLTMATAPPPALCPAPGTVCRLGDIKAGEQASVTFVVRGTALGSHAVSATAKSDRFDPDPANDSASATIRVGTKPDVSVRVQVNRVPAPLGGPPVEVTYTIRNGGEFPATDVRLTTVLPAQLKVLSIEPAGRCTTQPAACALGTLQPNETVTVAVRLSPDVVIDAVVAGFVSAAVDGDPGNNADRTPLRITAPDLAVTVDVVPEPGAVGGDPVTVTYTVINGGFTATDVTLTVGLPTQLPIASVGPANGCPATPTAVCNLGTLAPRATRTITFTLRPDAVVDTTVTAEVTGLLFGEARVGGKDSHPLRLVPPDLALAIDAAPQPGFVGGDPIVVTYTVANKGQFEARGVRLSLALPAQPPPATLVTTAGTCTVTPVPGCVIGTIPKGGTVTVKVTLKPADAAVDTSVAGEVTENVADGTPADNKASRPLIVLAPAVAIDPSIGPAGFASQVSGRNFPRGARVRLSWDRGLMSVTGDVVVADDGTFQLPLLIFRKDSRGQRTLTASGVAGPKFRPPTAPFLVVPGSLQPGEFVYRR